MHYLVNQHRESIGLAALEWNEIIAGQCRAHSSDIASGAVEFGHAGFEDRAAAIRRSIPASAVAENVAGYPSAEGAVQAWLASSGHRANIEGDYDLTGVGAAESSYGYIFTQIFVRSR